MKKLLIFLACSFIVACEGVDGLMTPPNFSSKEQTVSSAKQQITLKATNNVTWFLPKSVEENGKEIVCEGVNLTCDTTTNSLIGKWFKISKIDNQTLIIEVDSNTTNKERNFNIQLNALNAVKDIRLKQL